MANTITSDDLGTDKSNQAGNNNGQQVGIFPASAGSGSGQQTGSSSQGAGQQSGGSQAPTVQASNPNAQKGSGYTNIQRIMQANTGNQLGQTVGQGIQKAGQQVQQSLGNQQQQFQQGQAQNQFNTDANQQLVGNVLGNASQYAPTGSNDPNAQAGTKFQQLISGQYQGPTSLQNTDALQQQAANVGQLGTALNTAGGRMGVLQRFVGGPQYTSGQQTLDSLLLGQGGGQNIANARQSIAGLPGQINQAVTGAQEQGKEQQSGATQFGQQVQGQFGQKVSDINTGLQTAATTAQTAKDAAYQKAISDMQSGNMTQDEANMLGVTNGMQVTGDTLQNINQFVTEDPTKASAQNIASTQDYATLDALRQLAGQNASADAQATLGTYSGQNAQGGTFAAAPAEKVDQTGFASAMNAQNQAYQQALSPTQSARDAAQEISNLVNQRDQASGKDLQLQQQIAQLGQNDPQRAALQQQLQQVAQQESDAQQTINQKYPGASTGGSTRTDWANANLATANQKYQAQLAALQQAYGGMQGINIIPNQSQDVKEV